MNYDIIEAFGQIAQEKNLDIDDVLYRSPAGPTWAIWTR